MIHAVRLAALLFCVWFLLSGHTSPLLLFLGAVSALAASAIALRMEIVDRETYPVRLHRAVVTFWIWLAREIVIANLQVARCILDPKMPISPRIVRVKASQRSGLGLVTYANGITLTPGTVSIGVAGDEIEVHALTDEAARALESGEMDRRAAAMEKQS